MNTFEIGALAAFAVASPPAQTYQQDLAMLLRLNKTPLAAYLNITDTDDIHIEANTDTANTSPPVVRFGSDIGSIVTITGASVLVVDDSTQVVRPTTDREEIIGELRSYKFLANNWDGEGANKPSSTAIEEAVSFINGLSEENPNLEAMLHASGHAGLYWNGNGLYADIEFTGNGRLTYYIESGKGKHKGIIEYTKGDIPLVLATLLSA
jgi:hypothetical protein